MNKAEKYSEKWCPFVRLYSGNESSYNRDGNGKMIIEAYCITDKCMMWRSMDEDHVPGYCGLAGKPNLIDDKKISDYYI